MMDAIKKADVLIEALPYIKSYSGKIFVIKYGGSALVNSNIRRGVLQDIVFMSYLGIRPVVVHGGGPFINEELKKKGIKVQFKDGLRITTKEVMKVVDDVLNDINHSMVKEIIKMGGRAESLNTLKKDIVKSKPRSDSAKLGFVGQVDKIETDFINSITSLGSVPVISPVGHLAEKGIYNVNADEVSSHMACALKAVKLVLLTDVKGIMQHKGDESTLIPTLSMKDASTLINKKVIQSGMIPKVKACTKALSGGVSKTHIIDGRMPHSLLLEIFTDKGIGTEIVKTREKAQ